MNPEDVGEVLDQVTDRLAPASQAAWDIMVTEIMISSGFALFAGVSIVIATIVATVALWRISSDFHGDDKGFTRIFGLMGTGFGLLAGFTLVYNGVVGLLIPEFHLLNKFLTILQGS